ncbi:Retrovirus-related Pol polyprotein from transposon TNT 1-94, partial [Linum perenne]
MDLASRQILYHGQSKDGLYPIPLSLLHRTQPRVNNISLSTWHRRMGHANMENVKRVLRKLSISYSNKQIPNFCQDCCVGKMHKQPFPLSTYRASGPLDLICSDVWGPCPVDSVDRQ